jgi:RimJ/RimL family protein N-acetyltransferase
MLTKLIFFQEFKNEHRLLHGWLQQKHVREFWDDGDRTLEQVKNHYKHEEDIKRDIYYIDNQPAGYFQSYVVDENNAYFAVTLPDKCTMGLDFFIGEPHFLNRGFALPILSQFIETHCMGIDCLLVDPEPTNHKAIHLYTKYGFTKVGEQIVNGKSHVIMEIHLVLE